MNDLQNEYIKLIIRREEMKRNNSTSKAVSFLIKQCDEAKAKLSGQEWMLACEHLILEKGLMV